MSATAGGYVVYDCDIGNDDAWGLLMLIKGERLFHKLSLTGQQFEGISSRRPYKILGITCVQGNTTVDNCAKNALRVLESVDRLDVSKKVSNEKIFKLKMFVFRFLSTKAVQIQFYHVLGLGNVCSMVRMGLVIYPIYRRLRMPTRIRSMLSI